jgi:signal transduction histidine kinase
MEVGVFLYSAKDEHFENGERSSQAFLVDLSEEILTSWEARVRAGVNSANCLLRPALRSSLSRFLDLLGDALIEEKSRGMLGLAKDLVQVHARERAKMTTYSAAQMVQELQILREIVTAKLENALHLSPKEYSTIQKTFDQAIQESLMEYFLMHASLREQFVATLTHDLRSPLAAVRMTAQVSEKIARSLEDQEKGHKLVELQQKIVNALIRADRMIQELLDASVLRVGEKIPIHLSRCELLSLVQDALQDVNERAKARIEVLGESVEGNWDAEGLKRSIGNLIANAVKYGDAERPILVRVLKTDAGALVSVHNEGNPISEEDQKMLFQSFHRGRSAIESGQKGWGIGLALAKAVVEALGGSIHVESSAAAGTTFIAELPLDASG